MGILMLKCVTNELPMTKMFIMSCIAWSSVKVLIQKLNIVMSYATTHPKVYNKDVSYCVSGKFDIGKL